MDTKTGSGGVKDLDGCVYPDLKTEARHCFSFFMVWTFTWLSSNLLKSKVIYSWIPLRAPGKNIPRQNNMSRITYGAIAVTHTTCNISLLQNIQKRLLSGKSRIAGIYSYISWASFVFRNTPPVETSDNLILMCYADVFSLDFSVRCMTPGRI